jgi:hypothetical protein
VTDLVLREYESEKAALVVGGDSKEDRPFMMLYKWHCLRYCLRFTSVSMLAASTSMP